MIPKKGQRWLREDRSYDVCIIEVTEDNYYGDNCLGGVVVQVLKGSNQIGFRGMFKFKDFTGVKYTYLEGQDRP